ncbi:MAG: HlyD family type I secretion periplasmic adaptor subunit [Caulobacteraceae bacterium]|nr:HlyD family type I secretion periplasmic adaptor subunit [Caulobacteraceae bacterium]
MSLLPATLQKIPQTIQKLWSPDVDAGPRSSHQTVARIGYVVILVTFGLFGIWAATAPLDSAVIAPGVVSVEGNRKTVQHLEGGIVRNILVREGEKVKAGQVLFELDPTQAVAGRDIAENSLIRLMAMEARLTAERDNLSTIRFPPEVTSRRADPEMALAIADEEKQFAERRGTIQGQVELLETRRDTYRTEIEGIDEELAGMRQQGVYLDDEITGLKSLYEQDLVPKPRLLALQRERAALTGRIGRSIADRSKAQKGIAEASLQIRQVRQQFYEEVSKQLADTRTQANEIREKFTVAQDQVRRINIVSPVTGSAQNLKVFTKGAVIGPGAPLVDIVPDNTDLIVQAHFSPNDVDNLRAGMDAEVRFPSFHSRTLPEINGRVQSVSGDRLVDEATHNPYFLGLISVPNAELPAEIRGKLIAGMSAEVVVPTGERTVLEYIWEPITKALRNTGREE